MKLKNQLPTKSVPDSYTDTPQFIEVDSEGVPEVLGWSTGRKYRMKIYVEHMGETKDQDQKVIRARLKILDISTLRDDMPSHIRKLIGT